MTLLVFTAELVLLFLSSKAVITFLSQLLLSITKSHKTTVYILAFLFFPGTVVHELAHFFMAVVLGVSTGEISLLPKMQGDVVRLGSVQIAHTDLFRRFLIGLAPLIVGLCILWGALWYAGQFTTDFSWQFIRENSLLIGAFTYLLFVVANTMFSSKRDVEGAIPLVITVLVFVVFFLITGIQLPKEIIDVAQNIFEIGYKALWFPLGLNTCIIMAFQIFSKKKIIDRR